MYIQIVRRIVGDRSVADICRLEYYIFIRSKIFEFIARRTVIFT